MPRTMRHQIVSWRCSARRHRSSDLRNPRRGEYIRSLLFEAITSHWSRGLNTVYLTSYRRVIRGSQTPQSPANAHVKAVDSIASGRFGEAATTSSSH